MDIRKNYLLPFFVLLGGLLHGHLFLAGYRLSADDIAYHLYAMSGVEDSWLFIKSAAIGQGRVVHFPDLITSLIGAYFADAYLFRVFYVSLFFSNFILAGFYLKKLSGTNFGWFATLILFSFHPLDYFHLSPNAYPFKISFPVFLILVSRIALLNERSGIRGRVRHRENGWIALSFAGMMFSEYVFSFASSLICIELITRIIGSKTPAEGWIASTWRAIRGRYFLKDLVSILLFLGIYIAFRMSFPSAYEGNQLPAKLELHSFFKTLVGHIYGGTTFSSLKRYHALNWQYLKTLDVHGWILISLMFFVIFVAAAMAITTTLKENLRKNAQAHYLIVAGMALLSSLFVTAPVAITTKYQSWCTDINACVFLDCSLSYLGAGIFLAAMLLVLVFGLVALRAPDKLVIYGVGFVIALVASLSHLNNLRLEADMSRHVSGWERARKIACMPEKLLHKSMASLSNIVDPDHRIGFHPGFDANRYWLVYIANRKNNVDCNDVGVTLSDGAQK